MHSVVLVAVFAFVALTGMLLAAHRTVSAALVLVVGVGWPATLVPGESPLTIGAFTLAGVLAVLFLQRDGPQTARGLTPALAVGAVLVSVAVLGSSSDSVAKGAFLSWKGWDPYDRPDEPVGVDYVWNSNYEGIRFPKKETVVFRVTTQGSRQDVYWRATTLDEYNGTGWNERLDLGQADELREIDASRGPLTRLLPRRARNEDAWLKQDVTIAALQDEHLVGSAQPMRWEPPEGVPAQVDQGGEIVVLPESLRRDQQYTVWSYVPRVKPSVLAKAGTSYPEEALPYLDFLSPVPLPKFGAPGREQVMEGFFATSADPLVRAHEALYREAVEVVGDARSPYAAAFALESWFRSAPSFRYDEQPPSSGGRPALVAFVAVHRRGYCQQYAGSMALMLRFLGVPARVAAGFTSGRYDAVKHEWTVTDHNAHTWVEVYFPGFGWLPFDPTPGRGLLAAPYSSVSPEFAAGDAFLRNPSLYGGSPFLEELAGRLREDPRTGRETRQTPGSTGGAGDAVAERAPSIVVLALLVIAGGLALVVLAKAAWRTARFATRDPRRLASACRRDLVGFLADQGVELPPSSTLAEVGFALERDFAIQAAPFVHAAAAARFGPPAGAPRALERARRELRNVRRELRRDLGVLSRARGAISLRSFAL
jgi:transglutaminase-like putative cysteine protease